MNIFTADIILYLLLISVFNNPVLNVMQAIGWNFLGSEMVIGLVLLGITILIHKFVFRKIWKK
ncbi:hypothetical protein [Companilactobacillus nantensis]|uniref:hypothetical protein n=1 Tax=Companilactobacillus nantensis TaxID=305793 RepID=UPI000708D243|nr:hypothetical protein [Companilactobacillus nantensis]GEO63385.1 hypothetical protein LNA01_05680 [Companilactobacillus nantensis]